MINISHALLKIAQPSWKNWFNFNNTSLTDMCMQDKLIKSESQPTYDWEHAWIIIFEEGFIVID